MTCASTCASTVNDKERMRVVHEIKGGMKIPDVILKVKNFIIRDEESYEQGKKCKK